MTRGPVIAACTALLGGAVFAQSAAGSLQFLSAEIAPSPPSTVLSMRSGVVDGRYEIRNATLLELIGTAWGVAPDNVTGGPGWLEKDRFDITAKPPAGSTAESRIEMLRALLEDRFGLSVHRGTENRPAYVLTAEKKPKLKASDGGDTAGACNTRVQGSAVATMTCRSATMAVFAASIARTWAASGYVFNYPVIDRTGLQGAWDFTLHWGFRPNMPVGLDANAKEPALFAALEDQLGLKLERGNHATPVMVVERANRTPVGLLPPPAPRPQEFDVAEIKPDGPDAPASTVDIRPGGQVQIRMTLRGMIQEAWGDMNPARILGAPRSAGSSHWVVLAKAQGTPYAGSGIMSGVDLNSMRMMLRSLLIDRFQLQAHTEDRLIDGYELVAAKPKLRKADGSHRTGCIQGPGPDGKDPRLTNPFASSLVTCWNMTLAEFADALSKMAPEQNPVLFDFPPVMDSTGIAGRYDLTLNFSPPPVIRGKIDWLSAYSQAPSGDGSVPVPDGTISVFDAMEKQLGLKLKAQKVKGPVLVIEGVNETPTGN